MGRLHKRYTPMLTSRGCPQACIFCFYHILMGRKWRGRSPENVLGEIETEEFTAAYIQDICLQANKSMNRAEV